MASGVPKYSLYSDDILISLQDRSFFVEAIAYSYNVISLSYGTNVRLSVARLLEAYDYWKEDVARTMQLGMPVDTTSLDHFKHVSFIVFWLRRMSPLTSAFGDPTWLENRGQAEQHRREDFLRFANEVCALRVGLQICFLYESKASAKLLIEGAYARGNEYFDRPDWLRSLSVPNDFLSECAMILKHKSISPYSVYMMYKALFTNVYTEREWTLGPTE